LWKSLWKKCGNPVENFWHYLRSHYWANRIYADYDALRYAAIDAWQKAALDPAIIKSVCRAPYAERIKLIGIGINRKTKEVIGFAMPP